MMRLTGRPNRYSAGGLGVLRLQDLDDWSAATGTSRDCSEKGYHDQNHCYLSRSQQLPGSVGHSLGLLSGPGVNVLELDLHLSPVR
jgi:hypothetical protein